MRSGFRIEGDLEDAICGFYVALLANATGEAVVYARAGDEDPERFTTRAPDELCTWIEQRVERDWDVYGTLLTSAGELVGVRRRILAGMRAPTAPVPPSLSLETDEGNVIEVWLFDRALSSNNPIVTALQRSIEPERADGELQVPIPGVPSARARLLTPESATDLYERKIPYYSTSQLIEAFGVEAGLGTEDRLNDGVLEGDPDVALLEREIRIGIGAKRDTPPGRWKVIPTTVGGLIVTLTVHEVGDKDGTCFLQGECLDGKRHAKAMKAMYALVLDLDTGISAEEIDERVRAAGLLCLRYSTHSHMKDTTKIRDGAFLEWGKRQGKEWAATTDVKRAPELDDLRLYLLNEKGYRPHILRDLEFVQFGQDGDGGHILVRHAPIPKYRLVFILDKPYVFAEQGYQNHAIERWKRKYAGFAHGLGVWFDRSCVDPSRLFYRPRHAEGSPFEIRLIAGKPVILDDVPEVDYNRGSRPGDDSPFAVAAAELLGDAAGRTDYKEPRLRRWAALYADYFDVTALLEAREQKAEERERGGIYAYCPNRHAHTDEAAIQGCYANDPGQEGSGTGFTFRCTHDHCRDLDRLGLLDMLLEQKVIAWADLIDPDFSYGMPDDVRAKAEAALRGEESRPAPAATPSELQQRVAAVAKFDEPAIAEVCAAIVAADLSAVDRTDLLKALQEQSGHNSKQFGAIKSKVAKDAKPPKPSTEEVDTTIMSDKNMVTRLQEYNEKYALVMLGSDARIMVRPETAGTLPEFLRVDSWKLMTKPDKVYIDVGGEIKRVSVTQYWLEWDERKVYNGSVCFEPDPDFSNPHVFNLWGGWPIQPKPGDWSLLRDHIFTVICRRKPELFEWVMTWMAQIIQQPHRKKGSTIAITGKKGTGKSKVFEWFAKLFGPYGIKVSQKNHITGNFNAHQMGKLLMVCEEAFWAGDQAAGGVLKDLITSPTMMMERKGIDAIQVSNHCRLVMISNEDWIVPADFNGERRFCVLEASDEHMQDIPYFAAIDRQMENGGLAAMMAELLAWAPPGGDWNILRKPPLTEALIEQAKVTLPPDERFFLDMVRNGGCFHGGSDPNLEEFKLHEDRSNFIRREVLETWWMRYVCTRGGYRRFQLNADHLTAMLQKWLLCDGVPKPRKIHGHRFGPGKGKSQRVLVIPPRTKLREHLRANFHIDVEALPDDKDDDDGEY